MADIIFYTNPMSRGQIARWALHEVDADYEQVLLEYGTTMKAPDYLAVNPMGKVPAIKHGEQVVTEAAAICAYLAATHPQADLAPHEGEHADYFRWMFFAAGPGEQAITVKGMGWELTTEQEMTVGFGSYQAVTDRLKDKFEADAFVCGDRFTMADVYVGSFVDWGLSFGTVPDHASLRQYAERFRSRPAYLKAKAIDDELIAQAQSSDGS